MIIYLHGFASSPHSGKARYLAQRLRARGVDFHAPDLNLPDFPTLTVTRMLEQTRALIEASKEPVTLFGSSLGGFVAVNAAAKWPDRIAKLVLLAPALDFAGDRMRELAGVRLEGWKRAGAVQIFHYGYGRMMPVRYGLYEDATRYNALDAEIRMPVLAFQGRRDTAVDPLMVESWSKQRPSVELHLLDDDHQLASSLAYIWDRIASFLGIPPQSPTDSSILRGNV